MLARSYLYVPADNSRFLEKAETSLADSIILDLEDGVKNEKKQEARDKALAFLTQTQRNNFVLRVNPGSYEEEAELINQIGRAHV